MIQYIITMSLPGWLQRQIQTLELCLAQNFPFKAWTSNICSSATELEKEFLLTDHSSIADPI